MTEDSVKNTGYQSGAKTMMDMFLNMRRQENILEFKKMQSLNLNVFTPKIQKLKKIPSTQLR